MTVRRYATLWCDATVECGHWTDGGGAYERVRELRAAAKQLGWRRADGKDICPNHDPGTSPIPEG